MNRLYRHAVADLRMWEDLSSQAAMALAWAQAVELGDDVGTRTILIGVMRAGGEASDPDQLLRAVGVSREQLFDVLQAASPRWQIEPYAPALKPFRPPVLTPNATRVLDLAKEGRFTQPRSPLVELSDIFHALLQVRTGTAYRGLAEVLGSLPMWRVAEIYGDYLRQTGNRSFYECLIETLKLPADSSSAVKIPDAPTLVSLSSDSQRRPAGGAEWLGDARAIEDLLGRSDLAHALARRLERIQQDNPAESFLLHLDGPWGSGKSSVLYFLSEALNEKWLVVEFDAWRQSRAGPPWWALLTSLRKAIQADATLTRRIGIRAQEVVARIRRDAAVMTAAVLLLAVLAVGLLVTAGPGSVREDLGLATAITAGLALVAGLIRGAVGFLMWDSAMGARRYEQWHSDPMEGLADHFAWLLARSPRPVVFLVDDLDRAGHDYVVDLLDSIQTLVRVAGGQNAHVRAPSFVVAADGRWIRSSYEATYERFGAAVEEAGQTLGYLFLDKIFQLTVDVPAIGVQEQASYFRRLLRIDRKSVV